MCFLFYDTLQRSTRMPFITHFEKSMNTVGIVAFTYGFILDDIFFQFREISLCTLDGTQHALLKYGCSMNPTQLSDKNRLATC